MGLGQAINSALTGLAASQYGLTLVGINVANADTEGYTRKTVSQSSLVVGGLDIGVRTNGVNRTLDNFVQMQLLRESSGGAYADSRVTYLTQLDQIFGTPNGTSSLDASYSNFLAKFNALASTPESTTARTEAVSAAQQLATQLNGMTEDIQSLRSQTEVELADGVARVNALLEDIDKVNTQIMRAGGVDASTAGLLDQRDKDVAELATYVDIRVVGTGNNGISIYTSSGVNLFSGTPAQLTFDGPSPLVATSQWSVDDATRGVGTISLVGSNGSSVDLVGAKAFQSGKLAALLEMRDKVLTGAQSQLDAMAAALASSLSSTQIEGTAVPSLPAGASGFDLDVGQLADGNGINLTWTDTPGGTAHNVRLVRVDDPSVLPLSSSGDPAVVGIDWSGGMSSVVNQINAYFQGKVQVSNPSGTSLRFLDDGVAGTSDVTAVSATVTETASTGAVALPLFVDGPGARPYTGAQTAAGPQQLGFAGRITINPDVLNDSSLLVQYQSGVESADPTRPSLIADRLAANWSFAGAAGIGTAKSPFQGSISSFLTQMISYQGNQVETGKQLADNQDVVVNALKQRQADASGVNIDVEMSRLLELQNAYGANARVLTAVKDMFDLLMRM